MTLTLRGRVPLPRHASGGFDHGDAHTPTGRVFVAHTANGTVEVIDGEHFALERTLAGCPEASGALCTANEPGMVFAAARAAGSVLVIDPLTLDVLNRVSVGPRPNGLAWDASRGQLLVADVQDNDARLVDPLSGDCLVVAQLPGRPRWCVYDAARNRFLVNIREPAVVVALAGGSLEHVASVDGLPAGPHGMDLDKRGERALVACDAGVVVVLDLTSDREIARVPIAGEPDAVWYNAAADRAYVAIARPGVVDVIDGQTLSLAEEVSTEEGAHTTAFDAQRQQLYVFLPGRCEAAVYLENLI